MDAPEDDPIRARRHALRVAAALRRDTGDVAARVDTAARLLARWTTDANVRAALRPVFAAAVPHQRALIALGDIDAWQRDGRIALAWWEAAARGPDAALAGAAASRAGRAHLRGGRRGTAAPLLRQGAEAGCPEAAEALRRGDRERAQEAAARRDERRLALAERHLGADDTARAREALRRLERPDHRPGGPNLTGWEHGVRGELAFRRGELEEAADRFAAASDAPGARPRRYRLRLAQIAIARGDAAGAYAETLPLTDADDEVGEQAWVLIALHGDLIAAGMPIARLCTCCCDCCCDCDDED
ncbi:hypothetical protein [Actinomycetospora sp. NBRC 106378]|uniref:hypothetical protein n=1 Tax=Actinomycetospora sp. NBRC 106378 TaxID=3032208 RepID=UPI0024A4E24F|nr:hypothetical protein [Actinomycetospora sp. NBRC 106378]GLZ52944.1 hypothetical protein Acsp07_25610 [Actinomycetospora sp. NBRC 106378]